MLRTLLTIILALTIFSILAFIYLAFFHLPGQPITPKEFFTGSATAVATLITAMATLIGLGQERYRPRRRGPTHRAPSIRSGLYSGLIAGAISGLIIGVSYYAINHDNEVGWERIPIILMYGTATGALLGVAIQSGILLFYHLAEQQQHQAIVFNEVTGGMAGGLVGGLLAGSLGGAIFFPMSGFEVDSWLLFGTSIVGTVVLVLGTLRYDFEGGWRDILPSLLTSLLVTAFVSGIVVILFPKTDFVGRQWMSNWDNQALETLCGGAIIGLLVGVILGLEVGLGLLVYRMQSPGRVAPKSH
jgi:hypothetical protein